MSKKSSKLLNFISELLTSISNQTLPFAELSNSCGTAFPNMNLFEKCIQNPVEHLRSDV